MKLSRWKLLFVVLEVLLVIVSIILAFLEKDYRISIEVIIAVMSIAIAYKLDKNWVHIVVIIGLIVVDLIWGRGIRINNGINNADEKLTDNPDEIIEQEMTVEPVELDMKEDPLLKSLDKYTSVTGTDQEKMQSVITENIRTWKEDWDSLTLGTVSGAYSDARGRVDEIYTIRCIPEAESVYLQDDAVKDYDLCIEGIEVLYKLYTNPELKKEEAAMRLEKGNLCQRLGRESEAATAYHEAITTAWEGLEESIKYGMSTNAKDILGVLRKSYSGMKVLGTVEDEWDRKRAHDLEEVFGELESSFDDILKE